MRKTLKWTLSATLTAVALVGWSFRSAVAQNAMAKGKITVTVKGPMGEVGSSVPVALLKGNVPMPARGGGRRGGGGGAPPGGGAAPASQPADLMTGTTDAKGMYTFEGVEPGEYTVRAGNFAFGGGRRGGGAPGGAPATGPTPGVRGRGSATGTLKAGDELKLEITVQGGGGRRGGGAGGGGGRRGGGGAGGAAPGAGA